MLKWLLFPIICSLRTQSKTGKTTKNFQFIGPQLYILRQRQKERERDGNLQTKTNYKPWTVAPQCRQRPAPDTRQREPPEREETDNWECPQTFQILRRTWWIASSE